MARREPRRRALPLVRRLQCRATWEEAHPDSDPGQSYIGAMLLDEQGAWSRFSWGPFWGADNRVLIWETRVAIQAQTEEPVGSLRRTVKIES